jgi:hypothetical protein
VNGTPERPMDGVIDTKQDFILSKSEVVKAHSDISQTTEFCPHLRAFRFGLRRGVGFSYFACRKKRFRWHSCP